MQAETQIMLAEYAALRAEIERRAGVQWNVFALQVTSAGGVAGLAIATTSNFALLLIIPLASYMLGSRYILHDFHIKLIQRYIRDRLSDELGGRLAWERWKRSKFSDVPDRQYRRITRWTVLHPTRLAFEGVAVLALAAGAVSAAYRWWADPPGWMLIVGFAVMWAIGAFVTVILHGSFERSASPVP